MCREQCLNQRLLRRIREDTVDGINFESELIQSFGNFFDVVPSFHEFFEVFGRVWTCTDPFGPVGTHSDAFGCIRKRLDVYEKIRIFLICELVFDGFGRNFTKTLCHGTVR